MEVVSLSNVLSLEVAVAVVSHELEVSVEVVSHSHNYLVLGLEVLE